MWTRNRVGVLTPLYAISVILIFGMLAGCDWNWWGVATVVDPVAVIPIDIIKPPDDPPPPVIPINLWWEPPTTYTDNTPLNPEVEILRYEIALSMQATLGEGNIIGSVEGGMTDHFDLSSLRNGLDQWVSVRCVSGNNVPSDFAPPVLWRYP